MSRAGVSLLLQGDRLQLVETRLTRGRPVVVKYAQHTLPAADPDERLRAVREALAKSRWHARTIRVALPAEDVILRYFVMPFIPKQEWAAGVQFEVRKYLPFQITDLIWDFYAMPDEPAKRLAVVFVALRKETFATYQRLIQQAELTVEGFEPAAFGLARAMGLAVRPAATEITACVHIVEDTASIIFVRGQVPLLSREIPLTVKADMQPLEPLVEAAQPEPAEPPPAVQVPAATEAKFQALVRELRVSFEYFKRHFPQELLTRVVLFGETSLEYWLEPLRAHLRLPVEQGPPLLTAERSVEPLPSGWAMVAGAALGQVMRGAPGLVLSSQGAAVAAGAMTAQQGVELLQEALRDPEVKRVAVVELIMAGLLLWGSTVLFGRETYQLDAELKGLQREAQHLDAARADETPEALTTQLAEHKTRRQRLEALVGERRLLVTPLLESLAQQQEQGVWLTDLSLTLTQPDPLRPAQPALSLSGLCYTGGGERDFALVSAWKERLKDDARMAGYFAHVDLNTLRSDRRQVGTQEQPVTSFAVTCAVAKKE